MSTETLEQSATEAATVLFTLPDGSQVRGPWKPGRIYTYKSNDGGCEYLVRINKDGSPCEVISHFPAAPESAQVQQTLSTAAQLLQELRSQAPPLVEKVMAASREFYLRRMAWEDITAVWLLMPRLKNGYINWNDKQGIRSMTAAMLQVGVVKGPDDLMPYFDAANASAFVSEPAAAPLVEELFQHIDRINPTLLPKAEAQTTEATEMPQSGSPISTSAPSAT